MNVKPSANFKQPGTLILNPSNWSIVETPDSLHYQVFGVSRTRCCRTQYLLDHLINKYLMLFQMRTVLHLCLVVALLALGSAEDGARLLASKSLLNRYAVEGRDLTLQYNIYNVGSRSGPQSINQLFFFWTALNNNKRCRKAALHNQRPSRAAGGDGGQEKNPCGKKPGAGPDSRGSEVI